MNAQHIESPKDFTSMEEEWKRNLFMKIDASIVKVKLVSPQPNLFLSPLPNETRLLILWSKNNFFIKNFVLGCSRLKAQKNPPEERKIF